MSSVIQVRGLSKRYTLGEIGREYLFREVQSFLARLFRREDPNSSIEAQNQFWALQDVSLDVYKGDTVGITGPNGAGKSTLLKILARVTAPTHGKVTLHGRVASLLDIGVGFHTELTGLENIYLGGAVMGMSRAEIDRRFDSIVEFSELGRFMETPVKRFSNGMVVRLAFSIALHMEPEILLIDEVIGMADAEFRRKCLARLKELTRLRKMAILLVSHDQALIQSLCTRTLYIHEGHVKELGNPTVHLSPAAKFSLSNPTYHG